MYCVVYLNSDMSLHMSTDISFDYTNIMYAHLIPYMVMYLTFGRFIGDLD